MSKYLPDILFCIAYGAFLSGASGSFRNNGSKKPVLIMTTAVAINICISLLLFTKILPISSSEETLLLDFTLFFGIVFVWLTFFAALIFRIKKSLPVFHTLIAIVEICWFLELVLFIYGKYRL